MPAHVRWDDVVVIAVAVSWRFVIPASMGFFLGVLCKKRRDLIWVVAPVWIWFCVFLILSVDAMRVPGLEHGSVGYIIPVGELIGTIAICRRLRCGSTRPGGFSVESARFPENTP
jgi:hypothetical protein